MGDVSVQHVDREIVGGIASTALMKVRFHVPPKREPARAWRGIPRWDPAKTKHTKSALVVRLRVGHILLLMIFLSAAMPLASKPAKISTVLARFHRRHGVFLLAPAPHCRIRSRREDLFNGT